MFQYQYHKRFRSAYLILIAALLVNNWVSGQSNESTLYKNWEDASNKKIGIGYELMPLKNDTLIYPGRIYQEPADKKIYSNEHLYQTYIDLVWYDYNSKYKDQTIPIQWKKPLKVYLDKDLPGRLRRRFKSFICKNFNDIDHLEIGFEKRKNLANVVFENTTDSVYEIWPGTKLYKYYEKKFPNGLPNDHIKFYQSIYEDGSRGTFKLLMNYAAINSQDEALQKLIRAFYFALTGMRPTADGDPARLTTYGYELQDQEGKMDLQILKMHYHHIWDFGPNYEQFIKLTQTYED